VEHCEGLEENPLLPPCHPVFPTQILSLNLENFIAFIWDVFIYLPLKDNKNFEGKNLTSICFYLKYLTRVPGIWELSSIY
jgi:hypothetical protein